MRSGSILVLILALCAAGCGKAANPSPTPTGPSTAAASTILEPAAETVSETTRPTPAATEVRPIVPGNLRALGTEPFWNARIDGNALTYTTPDDEKGRKIVVARRETAIGAVFSGKLDGEALILAIVKRTCSDGMSDRSYSFSAVLSIGSQRRIGCAS